MANESTSVSTNGNFASQQSYGTAEHLLPVHASNNAAATMNGSMSAQTTATGGTTISSSAGDSNPSVSKDEVGWYFVEQYYTTLSRNPEKLHLFYSKRSQFVSGVEAEKVSVSVGQRAINERIKELDIQDCKVRVTNVDSQESFKNIVVQVIGEMSNKAAPHRKFAQTFVLAEQPNGYFVLNDIFRYISEEEEDEVDTSIAPEPEIPDVVAPEEEPKTLTSSDDPVAQNEHAELVDKKLEEKVVQAPAETTTVEDDTTNEQSMPDVEAEEDATNPIAAASSDNEDKIDAADEEESAAPVAEQDIPAEKPKDPDPTPVASPPKPAKAIPVQDTSVPAAPPKPAAPKTWANLVAANRVASPAVPNATSSTSPSAQPKAAPPPAIPVPAASAPANEDSSAQPQQSPGAGWQTAGHDSGKRQARQQSVSAPSDKSTVLGYVKNVTDKVDASLLKAMLSEYGKLEYFDVSRPKNCAFVEFADSAGYNAAVAANPHSIGGEQIYVEERRPRPTAYGGGFGGRGGMRGGRGGPEGRPSNQGRGGFQKDGGRGGFIPRGRGGSLTPRGRGMPQAA